jgi:hypothetical protein
MRLSSLTRVALWDSSPQAKTIQTFCISSVARVTTGPDPAVLRWRGQVES